MAKQKESPNLFPTLILVGTGFFLVFSVYFLTSSFYKTLHLAEDSAQKRLETITKSLSIVINGDQFEQLMKIHPSKGAIQNNLESKDYNSIHELLAYTKDVNELNTDVYTWVVDSNHKDGLSIEFGPTSAEVPYFRHRWESFPKEMIPIFYLGGALDEYMDENGKWISYFFPIFNSSGVPVGAIQADISYDDLVAEIKSSGLKKGAALLITVLFFIVVLMWILDRLHKKQSALLETQVLEGKYRELIDSSLDFIFTINPNKKITYLNKVFQSYYGDEEIIGKSFSDLVSKSQKNDAVEFIEEIIKNPKSDKKEFLIQSPSGDNVWMELLLVPTFVEGDLIGFQVTGRDVTEKKKLKHRVDRERVKAIHSLKSKENFFANMSHEIRTPLNAILGMESLVNKNLLPTQEQEYLSNIRFSAKSLLQIINDILDFSKIEAGKLIIEKTPFKIQSIIDTINRTFSFRFEEKGVELVIQCQPGLDNMVIESDLLRLNQVVINLVSNALKFTDEGTVLVALEVEKGSQSKLKVSVKDSGIGIPKSKRNNLFESFIQAEDNTARKFGGTGLGLAICKKITGLLGGGIEFESEEGEGTEFRFYIPVTISNKKISDVQEDSEIDVSELKGIKILVAEDNPINTVYISGLLDDLGFNHVIVENGQEVLDKIKEDHFDVILMDIQMPVMNGMEATKHIREDFKNDIPIIALTANAFPEDRKRVFEGGMNGFVTKPFEQQDLVNELVRLVKDISSSKKVIEMAQNNDELEDLYSLKKLTKIANGNEAFVEKMVQVFINETPLNISLFEQFQAEDDVMKIGQLAHKLKPSVDMFQIHSLSNVVREVEKMAKIDNPNKRALFNKAQFIIDQLQYVLNDLKLNRP